jgi:hypothetical protein
MIVEWLVAETCSLLKIKKANQEVYEDCWINLEFLTYAHTGMDRVKEILKKHWIALCGKLALEEAMDM